MLYLRREIFVQMPPLALKGFRAAVYGQRS